MRVERVETSGASTARRATPRLEPTDVLQEHTFQPGNQEKLNIRKSVQVTITRDTDVVSPVGIDHDEDE